MREKTATQIRVEMMQMRQAYCRLERDFVSQAEAIANHYIAHAQIALELKRVVQHYKELDALASTMSVMQIMVDQIKANHKYDFGIELEWPKRTQPEWLSQALNEGDGTYKP